MKRLGTTLVLASVLCMLCMLCIPGALCVLGSHASAQSFPQIWSEANAAYFKGDFDHAREGYEKLVQAGVRDADLYVNLATTHARLGDLGRAVLCFERALDLRPGDDGAEAGLATARSLLASREADQKGEAELRTRPPLADALVRPFSTDGLAFGLLLLDGAVFALLAWLLLAKSTRQRVTLGIAAALCGLGLVLAAAGLAVKLELFRDGEPAIVVSTHAALREGPDPGAKLRGHAREGEHARLLSRDLGHARVRLESGAEGWMNAKDLEPLRPD